MAKKRGFLRRLVDRIIGREPDRRIAPKPPTSGPKPAPVPPAAPNVSQLRKQAIDNMINQTAFSDRNTVTRGVNLMSIDELRWTVRATYDQIADRARQDPDLVLINGAYIPWNNWWYR